MQGKVDFFVCLCFLQLVWEDLSEKSMIAIAVGIRELPVLLLI